MARSRTGSGRSIRLAATPSIKVLTCSGVITSGSFWGALGVRTNRAKLTVTVPSRSRNLKRPRTAASLRRMVTAVFGRLYSHSIHSRRIRTSMACASGGSLPGGDRYSRNSPRSAEYAVTVWAEFPARASSCRKRSMWRASSGMAGLRGVPVERFQGAAAHFSVARVLVAAQFVARGFVELRQQIEGDVGRLVVLGVGARDVMAQRAQGGLPEQRAQLLAGGQRGRVHPGHQTGGDGFHVSFHARDLAGEEDPRLRPQLQGGPEQRGVDVRIAMNLPEAQELGVFEARDQAQDAGLLAEFQVVLE